MTTNTTDITITSEDKNTYLLINAKGSLLSKEELFLHCRLIYEEVLKSDLQRILINEPETIFPKDITLYFDLVKNYIDNFPPAIFNLKVAAVVAKEFKQLAETWETLCISRGLQNSAFTNLEDAQDWLLS